MRRLSPCRALPPPTDKPFTLLQAPQTQVPSRFRFIAGSPISVVKTTTSGTALLTGTEVVAGNVIGVTYYSTTGQFQLVTNNINVATPPGQVATYAMHELPFWSACCKRRGSLPHSICRSCIPLIGSTWGNGDGCTTFNVPDLRGRVCSRHRHERHTRNRQSAKRSATYAA